MTTTYSLATLKKDLQMHTRNAVENLITQYKAVENLIAQYKTVQTKINIINFFRSFALVALFFMGLSISVAMGVWMMMQFVKVMIVFLM